jgi:transcriptional regulator with XRE-family HTH domain
MDVGDRIRLLREQKGMTLEDLGNKVGVGKSTVRKWETGMIANMRRDKIKKVADALDTSPEYLMGWTDEAPEPIKPQGDRGKEALLTYAKQLYENYQKASPEIQKAVDLLLKNDKQP